VLNGIVLGTEEGKHEATNTDPAVRVQRSQSASMSGKNTQLF